MKPYLLDNYVSESFSVCYGSVSTIAAKCLQRSAFRFYSAISKFIPHFGFAETLQLALRELPGIPQGARVATIEVSFLLA